MAFLDALQSGQPNYFGYSPSNSHYARNTRAALLRSEYGDWKTRFLPIEDTLLDAYKNPAIREQAQEQGADLFQRGADASDAAANRRLASFGLTLTPEQQASRDRSSNLQRGLGQVDVFNRTARAIDDRDNAMLTGLSGAARGQVNNTIGGQ